MLENPQVESGHYTFTPAVVFGGINISSPRETHAWETWRTDQKGESGDLWE